MHWLTNTCFPFSKSKLSHLAGSHLRRQVALVLLHLAGKYVPKNPTALVMPKSSTMLKDIEIVGSNVIIKILTRISKC